MRSSGRTVKQFLVQIRTCIESQDDASLCSLLDPFKREPNAISQLDEISPEKGSREALQIGGTYADFLKEYVQFLVEWQGYVKQGRRLMPERATRAAGSALEKWHAMTMTENDKWPVKVFVTLVHVLKKTGLQAISSKQTQEEDGGEEGDDSGGQGMSVERAESMITPLRKCMAQAARPGDRNYTHATTVVVLANILDLFSTLGAYGQSGMFLKQRENMYIDRMNLPKGAEISFLFNRGRNDMMMEYFSDANKNLTEAFKQCRKDAVGMKRRILECLVIVRLRLDCSPPEGLLEEYGLRHLIPLATAVRLGNVTLWQMTMRDPAVVSLMRPEILLPAEMTITNVYKRLFFLAHRRWEKWATSGKVDPAADIKPNFIPLSYLHSAVKWQQPIEAVDPDEILSIVCALIDANFMKGYVAVEAGIVIMPRNNPFSWTQK
uniref:PCI domain-containing protein n=1 Tax=Chromera velia CCMP2878 TaxID=1169474 RepID=A0A0G4F658_9ALVE|eukprot:Cvel_15391.t1-p1 / transcript=Cvel_15391.t1 / gene=Cvel_15391 / organism=Chromera_velia_CCMP2878 / gene_product=Protein CSN12 homolog, putative / transcript_product=Protein CSN12 homolog, putative / location=Cvel_scaffold1136:31623-37695(-) / protein_length=435 / sequence_SO=supercontig / SO=protein_coding / is_pseudo=false